MKKILFVILVGLVGMLAFAQEAEKEVAPKTETGSVRAFRAGLNLGMNMEQSDGYTFVLGFHTDTALVPETLLLGTQMDWTFSHSGYTANPSMYLEWLMPIHAGVMTPFLKGNLGMFTLHENDETQDGVLAGIEAGLSFDLGKFYLEPGVQFGYPYMWGLCLRTGLKF